MQAHYPAERRIYYTEQDSVLGRLTLAASDSGLCGVYFFDQRHFNGSAGWLHSPQQPWLQQAGSELEHYFRGERRTFEVPLDLQCGGTPFQQSVWQSLLNIGYGQSSTYGAQARALQKPLAVRAVGGAIGRNPLSIIVPCHRVLGASGALTGYDGGLERKRFLLRLEGHAI